MTTIHINLPFKVELGVEVDEDKFLKRVAQLMQKSWGGDSDNLHPAAENTLVSARHLFREAGAWALASGDNLLDYRGAFDALLADKIRVTTGNSRGFKLDCEE
jgi:hypothetical protein